MKLGLIFDTEEHAKQWDFAHNDFTGNVTKYKWSRVPLNQTTTLTKKQYAELFNIPEKQENEDGEEVTNPTYSNLQSSYTLDKYALLVGNDFAIYDDDGNITGHSKEVVDVSNMLKVYKDE